MNKKITMALVTGITTGLAIYLISKMLREKKAGQQNQKNQQAGRKTTYAYEYTL